MLAVLDGPDADSGTVAEIGYAFARGKKIVGYRGDFRLAGDNVGSTVNLQVEHLIEASSGEVAATLGLSFPRRRPAPKRGWKRWIQAGRSKSTPNTGQIV